jgi:hypothetical protein
MSSLSSQIVVKLRSPKEDEIIGPPVERQEAEEQLSRINATLGRPERPDLPWLAVMGKDILSAHIILDSEY